jgi:hypothetical protein
MPHANVWIRRVNWETWEAIEDKSDWVNKALEGVVINKDTKLTGFDGVPDGTSVGEVKEPTLSIPQSTPVITTKINQKYCPNGHPFPLGRDRCFGKGCQYS